MLQMFNSKPVTLRTGHRRDKQLPYMPISEENPCLGWRGSASPISAGDLLIQCGRCCCANAATGNLSILLPMVTSLRR